MSATVAEAPTAAGIPTVVRRRFPHFDGLRAVAALTVLISHVSLASSEHDGIYAAPRVGLGYDLMDHLDFGVTIFFLISGFLLYRPFVVARATGSPVSIRRFYEARVLRVIPGYWLALTVLAIYPGLEMTFGDAGFYYGLVHNYFRSQAYGGLSVSWTLCVEASFYLLLPVYAVAIHRLAGRRSVVSALRAELMVLLGFGLVAVVGQLYITSGGHTGSLFYLTRTLPLTLDWFALGMVLALLSVNEHGVVRQAARPLAWVRFSGSSWWWALGWGCWLAVVLGETVYAYQPFRHIGYGAAAFFMLVPAVFAGERQSGVLRFLTQPVVVWLGVISFGIYLWQLRILILFHNWGLDGDGDLVGTLLLGAAGAAATVAMAAISFYALERPCLALKARRNARAAVAARGVPHDLGV